MTACTFFDPATGVITQTATLSNETFEHYVNAGAHAILDVLGNADTHYVANNSLVAYTEAELNIKNSLPAGWIWKMPERVAVDMRTVENARMNKIAEMSAACSAAILAGFKSSALGAEYLYPAKMTDQTNLAGSILDSLLPGDLTNWTTPFWCADSSGVWAFRMHTAAQIQQVGRDAKMAILMAMSHNETLRAQITTATLPQLDNIGWAP